MASRSTIASIDSVVGWVGRAPVVSNRSVSNWVAFAFFAFSPPKNPENPSVG